MTKQTKQAKGKTTANAVNEKALAFARKVNREYGPCIVIRAVAQKFRALKRRDVLAIAKTLRINRGTASVQFHYARSGKVEAVAL